jgi:putative nucleotidyltransferase with HDIG domain
MRIFAPRKTRSAKAASLTASSKWTGRLGGQLRNVDLLLRLAVCGVFLLLLIGVLGSWRAPFRYQLGQSIPDGILAKVDFERVNQTKTELARLERERLVAPVFRHNPQPLRDLEYQQLRTDLFNIADVHDVSELSSDVRWAFGFATEPSGRGELPAALQGDWQALRMAIGPRETAERQIDEIIGEFTQFIAPLRESGILDPEDLSRRDLTPESKISVLPVDVPLEESVDPPTFPVADALLKETLKAGGKLGRLWNQFPTLVKLQPLLERWLNNRALPTLVFDEEGTTLRLQAIRRQTPMEKEKFKRGQLLVAPGSRINEEQLDILRAQYQTLEATVPWAERIVRIAISAVLLMVLGWLNAYYLIRNEPRLLKHIGRLTVYLSAITVAVAVGRLVAPSGWRAEVVPLLTAVMILAIAYNQVLAALTGFSLALMETLSTGGDMGDFVLLMSAIAAAVVLLNQVPSRSKVVVVGFWTAVTYFVVCWGVVIIRSQQLTRLWTDWPLYADSLSGAGWCLAAGFVVAGSLPFVEKLFGVVTDISLLELSDISHPLLQELVRRAPGTYNHSIGVATISETAADAIGANGLLCRVGAYFHDIGKMLKPQYFVENMIPGQTSRHESLNPAMSTLIIIGHVKDGVDLGHQHNLPPALIDFIEQHHGTTLVEYFFHAATKQAEAQPEEFRTEVAESSFRYPGPRPQTREAAVMMIADAVEGASRALSEPTPKRIETLVHEIAMKRLLDGQFDECSLTLAELAIVEDTLTKSLIGIYHGRIKYPEQKSA